MTAIDSTFLYGARTDLQDLAAELASQETGVRALRRLTGNDLERAATMWTGPRANTILTKSNEYLDAIEPCQEALKSARGTLRRWADAADDTADAMYRQEEIVNRIGPDPDTDDAMNPFQDWFDAGAELDRLRAHWTRTCTTFASELDGAITAIKRANTQTCVLVDPDQARAMANLLFLRRFSSPEAIRQWWAGLTDDQRLALLTTNPGGLGNLDGLPAYIRDIANRTQLLDDLNRLEEQELAGTLSGPDKRELDILRNVVEQLEDGDAFTDPITGEPVPCQLYIYEPREFANDGRVAISTGDLDSAANIGLTVPGFTTNVLTMSNGSAQSLYDETRWASGAGVAVLNWQGYDTPDLEGDGYPFTEQFMDAIGVTNDGMAEAGAELLSSDVEGLNGMRSDDPHLTVVAHSYGSTTAGIAAHHYGLAADDLVLIGSPGPGYATSAEHFTTGGAHTWIGSASNDPVTYAPNLGTDPAVEGFGGTRFETENNESLTPLSELPSHTAYFNPGSESLHNISSVVAGDYDSVTEAPDRESPVEWQEPGIDIDLNGPPGLPGFPSIDIDIDGPVELNPEYANDPERHRDSTGVHTHEPLQPGGLSHNGPGR